MSTIATLCLQVSAIVDNCQPAVRNELTIVNPVVVSVWRDKARKSEPCSVAFRAKPIISLDDYYRPQSTNNDNWEHVTRNYRTQLTAIGSQLSEGPKVRQKLVTGFHAKGTSRIDEVYAFHAKH